MVDFMCSIRQRLVEEKRRHDEFDSKRLRAAAYQEAVVAEKNRDISRNSPRNGAYPMRRKPKNEDMRYMGAEMEGNPLEDDAGEYQTETQESYTGETVLERILQADWKEMIEGLFPAEA